MELAATEAVRITGAQWLEVALLDASETRYNCFELRFDEGPQAVGWKTREGNTLVVETTNFADKVNGRQELGHTQGGEMERIVGQTQGVLRTDNRLQTLR